VRRGSAIAGRRVGLGVGAGCQAVKMEELNMDIGVGEVQAALRKISRGKAAGVDGIYGEMLKYGGDWMIASLWKLFNMVFSSGCVPGDWRRGLIVPVPKGGDRRVVSNYRGITLLSVVGKVFTQIVQQRLSRWFEERGLLEPEQAGFRRGRSTVEHIFSLAEVVRRQKAGNRETYCCFLDIRKAYDTVWREGLWKRLEEAGVRGRLFNMIVGLYERVESCVVIGDQMSEWFDWDGGRTRW